MAGATRVLLCLVAAGIFSASATFAQATAVDALAITVSDAERSRDFFSQVLDFKPVSDEESAGAEVERLYGVFGARVRVIGMRLGDERIELTQFLAPRGRPMPADSRANDRWFQHIAVITSDMDAAYSRLREHNVEHASTGPQTLPQWNRSAGGIRAFYFRDPDGHFLEILEFPPGKGDPKWRRPSAAGAEATGRAPLFLGIDHSAVVVADTDASLRLYAALGFRVAGESENFGSEQERLNNVFGARLRITTLRVASGPGVELLEYLTPRDGRPAPLDTRANDQWHWHVVVRTENAEDALTALQAAGARLVSGATAPSLAAPERAQRTLVRDVDGHALLLDETR